MAGAAADKVRIATPNSSASAHENRLCPDGEVMVNGRSADLDEREIYGRVDRVLFNYREFSRWWHKPA